MLWCLWSKSKQKYFKYKEKVKPKENKVYSNLGKTNLSVPQILLNDVGMTIFNIYPETHLRSLMYLTTYWISKRKIIIGKDNNSKIHIVIFVIYFFIPGIWLLCTHILITHMNQKSATKSSPKFENALKNIGKCICPHHGLPNIWEKLLQKASMVNLSVSQIFMDIWWASNCSKE